VRFLLLLIAPLLLLQGKRVRARTIRLPEANGQRWGTTGNANSTPLRALVLGDSAAAGVGCVSQQEAVTGHWVAALSSKHEVHWQLVAQSSLTCAGVLQLLKTTTLEFDKVDVVLVSIGVNDVTRRTSVRQWQQDLSALTQYLIHHLGATTIIYTALPPMHKFPALPQPLRMFIGNQAKRLNQALQAHCTQQANTHYLAFEVPFKEEYMAGDGYHPSAKAAALWGRAASTIITSAGIVT